MKTALVTVNIDDILRQNQRDSFRHAADRWGAEYVEITELSGGMHKFGMKLLAFDLCDADRIFYIDGSDAIISIDCPNPFEMFSEDAFVAVRNQQPHMPGVSWRACEDTYKQDLIILGKRYGWVPGDPTKFINSGMWVASRKHHKEMLEKVASLAINHYGVTAWCDQSELNYVLFQSGVPVWTAPDTWNYQFPPDTEDRPMAAYIYHYTGGEHRDRLNDIGWKKSTKRFKRTEQKPKLLWIGDAVYDTGFARVTHNVCDYLNQYWDVHVLGINYMGGPHEYEYPIYAARTKGDLWGLNWFTELLETIHPQAICLIQDPWIVVRFANEFNRGNIPMAAYIPVDAKNQSGGVCQALNKLDLAIFYTHFGEIQCRLAGFHGVSTVIPHGVNLDLYKPIEKEIARDRLYLDALGDVFIVGNVNRNQPRKRLDLTIQYFAEWLRRDTGCIHRIMDAYLYLHCAQNDTTGGGNLAQLAHYYGIADRLIIPSEEVVTAHKGLPETEMVHVYNSFDVQISTTLGEGWGLTQMEGAACGIPQIVPMYSGLAEWMAGAGCMIPCGSSQMNIGINTIGGVVDKNLFIAALDRMYHDREYRAEYGKKALERAGNPAYRWSTIGETFNRVLEGMVEAKYGTTEKRNDGSDN